MHRKERVGKGNEKLTVQRERAGKDVQQVKVSASNRLLVLKYWSSQKPETSVFVGTARERFKEKGKADLKTQTIQC